VISAAESVGPKDLTSELALLVAPLGPWRRSWDLGAAWLNQLGSWMLDAESPAKKCPPESGLMPRSGINNMSLCLSARQQGNDAVGRVRDPDCQIQRSLKRLDHQPEGCRGG